MVVGSGIVYSDPLKRINLILRSIDKHLTDLSKQSL